MDSRQARRERARQQQQAKRPSDVMLVTPGAPPDYDPLRHAYVRKQLRLFAEGKLAIRSGELQHIEIAHDDDCPIFRGEYCSCDPTITVQP